MPLNNIVGNILLLKQPPTIQTVRETCDSTTAIYEKQVNDKSTPIVMQKPTVQHSGKQMMRRKNKTKLNFHDQTYKSVNDSPHETLSEHPVCLKLSPQVGKRHQSRCLTTRVGSVTFKRSVCRRQQIPSCGTRHDRQSPCRRHSRQPRTVG